MEYLWYLGCWLDKTSNVKLSPNVLRTLIFALDCSLKKEQDRSLCSTVFAMSHQVRFRRKRSCCSSRNKAFKAWWQVAEWATLEKSPFLNEWNIVGNVGFFILRNCSRNCRIYVTVPVMVCTATMKWILQHFLCNLLQSII